MKASRTILLGLLLALPMGVGLVCAQQPATEPRNPFWPVGYTPPVAAPTPPPEPVQTNVVPAVAEPAVPDPLVIERMAAELARKIRAATKVQAIMKTGTRQFATINGKVVTVGDRLDVTVDGQVYRFKVTNISASVVNMEPVNP